MENYFLKSKRSFWLEAKFQKRLPSQGRFSQMDQFSLPSPASNPCKRKSVAAASCKWESPLPSSTPHWRRQGYLSKPENPWPKPLKQRWRTSAATSEKETGMKPKSNRSWKKSYRALLLNLSY